MNIQVNILKTCSDLFKQARFKESKLFLLENIKNIKNIKIDKNLYYALYWSCNNLEEFHEAKKYLEKFLEFDPKNHIGIGNLANVYMELNDFAKAEELYLKAIEIKNDYTLGFKNLAVLYQYMGKLKEAKKNFRKAIILSPKELTTYENLSKLDKNFIDKEKKKYIEELLKTDDVKGYDRAAGNFLLAEDQRKEKNFTREMEYLDEAYKNIFNNDIKGNKTKQYYYLNFIVKRFNKFHFTHEDKENKLKSSKPIFILGLPRSGTTITEAILSSGSSIKTFGETNIINEIIVKECFAGEVDVKDINPVINLETFSNHVLAKFNDKNFDVEGKTFVDKSLQNFFYIDVILKIFPEAKFINSFRNIEDNIFAIFHARLIEIPWTFSVENILIYVNNYLKVIDYFINKYPDKILQVDLEELTNKPEANSKKIYSFCDLEWKKEALDFYKKEFFSTTASNVQIRENIKKYDYNKYKPYKEFLKKFKQSYPWLNVK